MFESFERFEDTYELYFVHPAEYIALQRLSGQIDKTTAAMFAPNYLEILDAARGRIASGFKGTVPKFRSENMPKQS